MCKTSRKEILKMNQIRNESSVTSEGANTSIKNKRLLGPSLAVNRLTLKPEQSAQWQHQLFRLRPARHGGDAEERNVKGRTVVLTSKSHREK
ncbi:unnamed protein product, partial [Acanthocheilonema viteae]